MKIVTYVSNAMLLLLGLVTAIELDFEFKDTANYSVLDNTTQLKAWPSLSASRAIALRTERDISANVSLSENTLMGVDLTSVVFQPYGYNASSLTSVTDLLNVGVQALTIDLYYNEQNKYWGLCPKSQLVKNRNNTISNDCDVSTFNITSLFTIVNQFILNTNNDLNINVLYLLFNVHSIRITSQDTESEISSLGDAVLGIDRLAMPGTIDNNKLPTLNELFFRKRLRVLPIIIKDDLYKNTSYNLNNDVNIIFSSDSAYNSTSHNVILNSNDNVDLYYSNYRDIDCVTELTGVNDTTLRFSYDTFDDPFTVESFWNSILCGYSPIINHSFRNLSLISKFLDYSFWSWSPDQPTLTQTDILSYSTESDTIQHSRDFIDNGDISSSITDSLNMKNTSSTTGGRANDDNGDNDDNDDNTEFINRCAVITKTGWVATSCNRKLYSVCRNVSNTTDYKITEDSTDYMQANDNCKNLGCDYRLYVPRSALEQSYLIRMIPKDKVGLWIDLNSLSSKNCWVVGLNTDCPYQIIISRRIFKEMITPSSVMAFVLLMLLVFMQFERLPIHRNRTHWKKLLNEKTKNDFEGVPV